MKDATDLRKRLESSPFPSLGAMMEGYAQAAAEWGESEFQQKLDFSPESIHGLDEILLRAGQGPEENQEFETRLWGSYLGEVLRRRYAGNWEMTPYPGGAVAVPAVEMRGSRIFPLMKVFRRLTIDGEQDLPSFYAMVIERLGSAARVN
ncbi:MAG: hypothetical protein ACP5FH_00825 [Terracidiphilus sp.]